MKVSQWLLIVSLMAIPATSTWAQTTGQSEKKQAELKGDIASLEHQKRTGMWMTGGGMAAELLSIALVPGTSINADYTVSQGSWVPFYVVLGAGTVVGIMGIYKWYDASQQLGPLKAKKYDLGFVPTWDMNHRDFGLALVAHF